MNVDTYRLARVLDGLPLPPGTDAQVLGEAAMAEGVGALLLAAHPRAALDAVEHDCVSEQARADAICQAARDVELRRVLEALAADHLAPVLLKGAHLAHAVYPRPWLRPRSDTDLLITPVDRGRFAAALERCGYAPATHVRGRVILGQFHFHRTDRAGVTHYLDVHWRVAAPLVFQETLPPHLFFEAAEALPALGPHARVPPLPLALLLACVHLVAHHRSNPLLLWLYDLRLVADALDDRGRERFVELTRGAECCAIAAHALGAARELFESAALSELVRRLQDSVTGRERSAALLDIRRPAGALWIDVREAGWRDRARLLREHLLPDREYMAHRRGPLPVAYGMRIARGVRRWLSPVGALGKE